MGATTSAPASSRVLHGCIHMSANLLQTTDTFVFKKEGSVRKINKEVIQTNKKKNY